MTSNFESSTEQEVVIEANNLGVTYSSTFSRDDYKSHAIKFLTKKNKKKNKSDQKVFWPLKGLTFTGYKGEVLGIVGSNGSGKTTLCKVLSGILTPDQGDLKVNGKVSVLFSMGMGFNKDLTGKENVYLNGMMLGISKEKIDQFIDDIHEFSELEEFFNRPMKTYSSGMKARLGFSVASHLEPEILILDEALNTGDAAFGDKAAVKIRELLSKAKMVIIVTHSHKYAVKNCDRLIWLEKGEIREVGDPSYVMKQYEASLPQRKQSKKRKLNLSKTNIDIKNNIVIEADNLSILYKHNKDEYWALNKINFTINEGEIVGLIGHNGAGKSTLCKVMTKILAPDEGNIKVDGDTTALLNYGTGFNKQLSGKDNILLNGMLMGIPKKRMFENYQAIVSFAELNKVIDKPIKEYSSGMKARLGFSIAATLKPDIFIIDEALSTGDMAFKEKASERIQNMIEDAKAVVLVSHSMSMVEKICTRVIWMENGHIKFDGDSKEGVRRYREDVKAKRTNKKGILIK
ncbi:ABC transporter ATP-binding protein [Amphibacillus jilinensis]|uniref:ABC transporter ATP-binding protein n=1 Tax=Amphibacillus jilinensis TaxID=1216008 RepID=UPI00030A73EE|nr:ATP-binding cassette domain-containing protein [Amphibacillus jilinensis]